MSSLLQAVLDGDVDAVRTLTNTFEAVELITLELNAPTDAFGARLVHVASTLGFAEILEQLITAGADAESCDNDGWRPIHESAKAGKVEATAVLLKNGAAVDSFGAGGVRALHVAVMNGHSNVAKLLLGAGSDACKIDDGQAGASPLCYAACGGDIKVCCNVDSHEITLTSVFYSKAIIVGHSWSIKAELAEKVCVC